MAEKGFGVKEVNLIGASGTPTITSPNNINLNAANVAISTNVSVGGTMTVTGGAAFGIGSTVGIGSTLYVSHGDLYLRDNHELNINNDALTMRGNNGGNSFITNLIDISGGAPGNLYISNVTGDVEIDASEHFSVKTNTNEQAILATQNGSVALYHDGGNKKLETNSSGVTVTGTLSATTFSGSGASLTTLPAANLTGTLPAISGANLTGITITPTNSDIQVVYTVTANGSSAYRFAGNGVVSTADDPDLYLIRGQKYRFINNSGGSHPFQIREASGGTAYSTGVTNNGAASGNIDFAPTFDSPAQLVYQCTSHSGMVGNIYLRDAAGGNTNVGVTTFSGGMTVSGNTSFAGDNVTMTASGSPNSLDVSGTARIEIASMENALLDGSIEHTGDTDTKISFDTNTIKFDTAGSEGLRIDSGGRIFTGNDTQILNTERGSLHVSGGGTAGSRISIRGTATGAGNGLAEVFAFWDTNKVAGMIAFAGEDTTNKDDGKLNFYTADGGGVQARMKISKEGYVTKPNHPCFAAKGVTTHTAGSTTHIDYTTQLFDNGGNNYDPSAGQSKFTAPVDGYYFFHATCMFDSNLSGFNYCFLDFKINGTTQGRERMMPRPSGGAHASIENSAIFYLTASQYVQVYVTQSGGTAMNVRGDYRFFEGYLIG